MAISYNTNKNFSLIFRHRFLRILCSSINCTQCCQQRSIHLTWALTLVDTHAQFAEIPIVRRWVLIFTHAFAAFFRFVADKYISVYASFINVHFNLDVTWLSEYFCHKKGCSFSIHSSRALTFSTHFYAPFPTDFLITHKSTIHHGTSTKQARWS